MTNHPGLTARAFAAEVLPVLIRRSVSTGRLVNTLTLFLQHPEGLEITRRDEAVWMDKPLSNDDDIDSSSLRDDSLL
jgi:hypothetical protein